MSVRSRSLKIHFYKLKNQLDQAFSPVPRSSYPNENQQFQRIPNECNGSSLACHHSHNRMFTPTIRPSLRCRIKGYFTEDISEDLLLEAELLLLSFATGIEDSVTFPDYHCFVSNQTGNTVLFAIGVAKIAVQNYVYIKNSAISLTMFIIGNWVLGQLGNFFGCYQRGWILVSSFIQTLLVVIAVVLQHYAAFLMSTGPGPLLVIALLALSSGGQVAMVRSLEIGTEITTANTTSAYVDTVIDVKLFELRNRSRNRRLLFLLFIFGGSFAGAYAHKFWGSANALALCMAGKTLVTVAIFFNKGYKKPILADDYESSSLESGTDVEKEEKFDSKFTSQRFMDTSAPSLPLPILSPPRLTPHRVERTHICRNCHSRISRLGMGDELA